MMRTKPCVLFIASLPPPIHGSAIVSQQIKNSSFIQQSFDCDFINLSTSRRMDEIGKLTVFKLFRITEAFFHLFWNLLTKHYDLCYVSLTCHGRGFLKDAPFALLCKTFKRPLIIHQHNKGMSKDVDRWPYRWLIPMVYKNARVILLSWRLYQDIEKIVPKENVLICPNGINVSHVLNDRTASNDVVRLLFLGNLMESKGVLVLLDALKILADKGVHFQCFFVGSETQEIDSLRFKNEVTMRNLDRVVSYLGEKYGDEKEEIMAQSDIFVFPSCDDCFPLVLLEAMSFCLPIVTTDEGGIPDMVIDGENGFICRKNDIESLAKAILELILSPELRQSMGLNGQERCVSHYTQTCFEKVFVDCLKQSIE